MGCTSSRDLPVAGQHHTNKDDPQQSTTDSGTLGRLSLGGVSMTQHTRQEMCEAAQATDGHDMHHQQPTRNSENCASNFGRNFDDSNLNRSKAAMDVLVREPERTAFNRVLEPDRAAANHLVTSTGPQDLQYAQDAGCERASGMSVSHELSCISSTGTPEASSHAVHAPCDMADTEEEAWARLEEKILAEVSDDLAIDDTTFAAHVGDMADLEEILVFEDEGDSLKFLDQEETATSLERQSVKAQNHGSAPLQVRKGQWAIGDFAQPGALMAGGCEVLSCAYQDILPDRDSTHGHVYMMGEECGIDIDDIDDSDTISQSQLQEDITLHTSSVRSGSL